MRSTSASSAPLDKPKHQSGFRAALHDVHWGYLFFGLINFVGAAVTWDLFKAHDRPFVLYDASLSRPVKDVTFTIPIVMAVCIVLALCQLAVCEFVLMRGVRSSSARWATFLQAIIHLWFVFWFQSFIQQLFASWTGKQRPSFLAECDPVAGAYDNELPIFRPNGQFQPTTVGRTVCTNKTKAEDASKSFFSGHASSSVVILLFTIAWYMYTVTVRAPPRWSGTEVAPSRTSYRLWDFKRAAVLFFNCAQMFFFLVVGLTRYTDNKHHIEDVVTGFYVGTIFAALGVWDLASIEREMMARHSIPPAEQQLSANDRIAALA